MSFTSNFLNESSKLNQKKAVGIETLLDKSNALLKKTQKFSENGINMNIQKYNRNRQAKNLKS